MKKKITETTKEIVNPIYHSFYVGSQKTEQSILQRNIDIVNKLSPEDCKILLQVMLRLNNRGELCKVKVIDNDTAEFETVSTEQEFYEAAGIDRGAWMRFKKAINPWQLITRCDLRVKESTYTYIIFDTTFFGQA